jgi:hypothetical protein
MALGSLSEKSDGEMKEYTTGAQFPVPRKVNQSVHSQDKEL